MSEISATAVATCHRPLWLIALQAVSTVLVAAVVWVFLAAVAAAASPATPAGIVAVESTGTIRLTDARGFAFYVVDTDPPGGSACGGICAQTWPPVTAPSGARPSGDFTIVTRADGTMQWAYRGHALYRFAKDAAPGTAAGDGFGGRWHVASFPAVTAEATPLATIGQTTATATATRYAASNASTGTKTNTPIFDTPLNVQVVTQQVLQDQQVVNIGQAVTNVSAVNVGAGGAANNGQPFSTIFLRGFQTDSHFINGVRIDSFGGDSNTFGSQFANVQSIEVLKGPAAILYGAVEPGGIVNIVTKQPLSTPSYVLDQQVGTYGSTRTALDAGGPLGGDGSLTYRLNASFQNAGSWIPYVSSNDTFFAPVLRWNIDHASSLTLQYNYNHNNIGQYFGFQPQQNGVPVNPNPYANYGTYSPDVEISNFVDLTFNHAFGDGWKLKATFASNATVIDSQGIFPFYIQDDATSGVTTPSGYAVGRFINNVNNFDSMLAGIVDLTKTYTSGKVTQTLLFGTDYYHFNYHGGIMQAGQLDTNISWVDLLNPVNPGTPFTGPTTQLLTGAQTNGSVGLYAQDQAQLPGNVDILAGLRYQGLSQTSSFNFAGAPPSPVPALWASALTARLGALWHPESWAALYANYAQNFGPNQVGYVTTNGQSPPPTRADQWEVGAKFLSYDQKLAATFAYFDITKTNLVTPDLANPAYVLIAGAARSNGIEFDLQGNLAPGLQATANYSNIDAFITQSNDPNNPPGTPLGEVPHWLAHVWLTYAFPSTNGRLKIGAGGTFSGPTPYLFAGTSGLMIPSYNTADAMIAYSFASGRTTIRPQINATNLFNRRYLSDAQAPGFPPFPPYASITAIYGAPLQVTGELAIQF